jgi:hypothetical protein
MNPNTDMARPLDTITRITPNIFVRRLGLRGAFARTDQPVMAAPLE